ncbi:MAG: DNA mismatch repair endonuclease MutL [Chitinophagaceae bacterium]|nr:DNA mismatch repair endonuclease MutL [Chitinophagaceae bacterium]
MPDIIGLLPDNIANQIAAGEVIQRPASAVKEMLENAIDAGATQIHLIIKDAGKELIQVNDNGKGMSPIDARLCFERHATSKIKSIDDLFAIRTMGFRGEALASIAAVAQVELKTRTENDEIGTCILIDNSTVRSQEPCQSAVGSSLAVKNLFFNVPARRNFLKTNTVEMRHIVDEFIRVAMANPAIGFQFTNNNNDIFNLEKGKLKQRIIALLGNNLMSKLVPVEEPTDFVQITGFVGTPDISTKTRGNQFFFVNDRFIKSPYLNHAVSQAYRELIGKDEFPLFVLFIDIEPKRVDINVHPTKQEIKFEDDRIIYSFVSSAVKHALSKYSIAPSLDFSLDSSIEHLTAVTQPFSRQTQEHTKGDFLFQSFTEKGQAHFLNKKEDVRHWKDMYKIQEQFAGTALPENNQDENRPSAANTYDVKIETEQQTAFLKEEFTPSYTQINLSYIVVSTKTGFLLVDQQLAHQRILYERFEQVTSTPISIQKCLLPQTFELPPSDAILLLGMLPDLLELGYEVEEFGKNSFILQGIPADVKQGNEISSIEKILEAFKHASSDVRLDKRERLIRTLAMQRAIQHGKKLSEREMERLMQDLFVCEQPQLSPTGKKIFAKLSSHDIDVLINNA